MKTVSCPVCGVNSEIPDEARAYKCSNCDSFIQNVDGRPRAQKRESANNSPLAKILVLALGTILILAMFGVFGDCTARL